MKLSAFVAAAVGLVGLSAASLYPVAVFADAGVSVNDIRICGPGENLQDDGCYTEDQLVCDGKRATIVGTDNPDNIEGTDGDDVIVGLADADVISGGEGNDTICGGVGNDTLLGGNGDDVLRGEAGDDVLRGNKGNDVLAGVQDNDKLDGGQGQDYLNGGRGSDKLIGGNETANGPYTPDAVADTCNGGFNGPGLDTYDITCETIPPGSEYLPGH